MIRKYIFCSFLSRKFESFSSVSSCRFCCTTDSCVERRETNFTHILQTEVLINVNIEGKNQNGSESLSAYATGIQSILHLNFKLFQLNEYGRYQSVFENTPLSPSYRLKSSNSRSKKYATKKIYALNTAIH